MATTIAAPPLDARYESRNSLSGKWPAIIRRALWMFVFIYAFVMIGVNFVQLRLVPTYHVTITPFAYHRPSDYWGIIGVSLFAGAFTGAVVVLALTVAVGCSHFAVLSDRLRIAPAGLGRREILFRDILGVEIVAFSSWPRRGSFWSDIKRQFQYLGTIHWTQHGMSQFFNSEAKLIMVKVAGRKWMHGYLLDVDDPERLLAELDSAISDYVGANGPEQQPPR